MNPADQQSLLAWMSKAQRRPANVVVNYDDPAPTGGSDMVMNTNPPISDPPNVVRVGANRAVKNLAGMKDGFEYVLDVGTYDVPEHDVKTTLIIRSDDPANRATLRFPSCWKAPLPLGPDCGSPSRGGTINVIGTAVMKDVLVTGGETVIVFGSQAKANITTENVTLDGGGIWRGAGGNDITLSFSNTGKPHAYHAASFTNPVQSCMINIENNEPVQQGGVILPGGPQGESTIRVCNAVKAVYSNVRTVPWFHDGKHQWKQDIQFRPDSRLHQCVNCQFTMPDIGDISLRQSHPKAMPVDLVEFIDCDLKKEPHYTQGAKAVKFTNTKVGGVVWNKTIPH